MLQQVNKVPACPGDSSQLCGGSYIYNVFYAPPGTTNSDSTNVRADGSKYVGCYRNPSNPSTGLLGASTYRFQSNSMSTLVRGGVIAVTTGTMVLAPSYPPLSALFRVMGSLAKSVVTITSLQFMTLPLSRLAPLLLSILLVIRAVMRTLAAALA